MENVIFPIKVKGGLADRIDRWKVFTPINLIVIGYALLILIGALVLMLPWATISGTIGFTDALFTSTSAATVTGLVVKETGSYFTFFGQLAICFLIEIGGIGYMAIFGFFILSRQTRMSLSHRMLLRESLNSPTVKGISRMARRIFMFIVFIQLIGAAILTFNWWHEYGRKALWFGIFHTVAAFNNAGFDILGTGRFESLGRYTTDITVNLVFSSLIILGGIGFYVLSDIFRVAIKRKKRFSYQTKIVCTATALLIILGTLSIFLLEYNNPDTLGSYKAGNKLIISYFHSVTPRTAGFSTVPMGGFLPISLVFIIFLMFIGASPGGTGGGTKTTTIAIFWAYIRSCIKGDETISLGSRRILTERLNKAVVVVFFSLVLILTTTTLLVIFDKFGFLQSLFEATSAFGTVGLTMGITPYLSAFSKYLIMAAMFAGKVGVFTLVLFFSKERRNVEVTLPTGDLTI